MGRETRFPCRGIPPERSLGSTRAGIETVRDYTSEWIGKRCAVNRN
jgi:hypothetical protein